MAFSINAFMLHQVHIHRQCARNFQNLQSIRIVAFGVKLQAEELALLVAERGDESARSKRDGGKSLGQFQGIDAVIIAVGFIEPVKQRRIRKGSQASALF